MKRLIFLGFVLFFAFLINVQATEIYYTNNLGVSFTKEEYDFFSKIYWDGIQKFTTIEEYNKILGDKSILNSEIESNIYIPISLYDSSHSTKSKTIKISKMNSGIYSIITVVVDWKTSPKVRSYDVIGANLANINLIDIIETSVYSDNVKSSSNNYLIKSNGFGVSIKLPSSGTNIKLTQSYRVLGSGTIYASYQHATKNISLANSQKYSISTSGYGKVFLFDSSIRNSFDAMGGVDITI